MIFARQGVGRRKAGALQGRQRSIAEIKPQRLSIFYLSLVLNTRFIKDQDKQGRGGEHAFLQEEASYNLQTLF